MSALVEIFLFIWGKVWPSSAPRKLIKFGTNSGVLQIRVGAGVYQASFTVKGVSSGKPPVIIHIHIYAYANEFYSNVQVVGCRNTRTLSHSGSQQTSWSFR